MSSFQPPSYESIRDSILRNIRSLLPDADIGSDSDNFIRSAAVAAAIEGLYQRQAWIYRQIFPDTADEAELLRHAGIRNIRQRAAVSATGVVVLSGTKDTPLSAGTVLKHVASGSLLTASADTTVDATGVASVPVVAQELGSRMNGYTGAVMFTSPPLGIDVMATLSGPLTGGSDIESPASVLMRLLDLLRNPPSGGAAYDYKRWALEVDGVASATVLPKRRGPNTVDIVITGQDGAPSSDVVASCAAHIDYLRPVTAEVFVYAPIIKTVNASAKVELQSGYTLAQVNVAAQAAYNEELALLTPGETLKRNRIGTLLGNLAGVTDYLVQTPTTNVTASDSTESIGWVRPGAIVLELMQ